MSIAITKYMVVAYDKDDNLICRGITENENALDAIASQLRDNGYIVRCYDINPNMWLSNVKF